jgi:beta-N-acetylhexosaminidase
MSPRAFISGCAGPTLGAAEITFFREADPWGFILFRRNCETPEQVRELTSALREAVGRDAPVLIDQEGGRVQRLGPPHWPAYPAARVFGEIAASDRARGARAAWLGARLMAADLHAVGIDVDCVPCLDVPIEGANDVIGRRAYGLEPEIVAWLGASAAGGLLAGGVLPVMKHVPGHGRAGLDSHLALPIVETAPEILAAIDFSPFRALRALPLAMTAHVVFASIDPDLPATLSATVIRDVIRGAIGFDGCLMTDDLSMKALAGSTIEKATRALAAGCDLILHCNGDLDEMRDLAAAVPLLAGVARDRADLALAQRLPPEPFDHAEARAEFAGLVGKFPFAHLGPSP